MEFEWDAKKEKVNLIKHGVSSWKRRLPFSTRPESSPQTKRTTKREPHLFCIGRGQRGILTVRFTQRGGHIRIIGAGYWRKGKEFYEKTNR